MFISNEAFTVKPPPEVWKTHTLLGNGRNLANKNFIINIHYGIQAEIKVSFSIDLLRLYEWNEFLNIRKVSIVRKQKSKAKQYLSLL